LGKTHLLMAIGHAARAINPRLVVEYLTLDEFVEAFHAAIAAGHGEAYRKRFLDVDLLLVDDVQFLTHRREMQAELLRLTDALQTASRQIVLTSDRPPADIEALDERLIRRFAGGLIIDVAAPDYETRVAILRRKAEERRATFAEGVIEAVAGLDIDNVRELLGALNRLIAFQAVSPSPLDVAQARVLVGGADAATNGADAGGAARAAPATAATAQEVTPPPVVSEFDDFLSDVTATLSQQVETWRARVGEAILRWEGEGYRTARLVTLLNADSPVDPERALREYEADVERLRRVAAEIEQLSPELAGSAVLRDPDDVAGAEALLERTREGSEPPAGPVATWRLDDMIEGPSSRMALAAARAAASEPGVRYNPLVIVGGSGVGKTHLLHGLGNALVAAGVAPVACLSTHEFIDELIGALDRDRIPAWRARYRRVGALLLDDVHLIAGKDRTQDELFWLFNFLFESSRQMAFTSAVPLAALAGVEPRLLTRLEGGLVVELPAPDREVRQRVVERVLAARAESDAGDSELAAYLAARPADSVRTVHGLVQRVLVAAESQGRPASAALARELLEGPAKAPRRPSGRASGVVAAGGGARSREKMVWDWADVTERALEDWR
jgi:chromosomal replication initiation ATPase DnaA